MFGARPGSSWSGAWADPSLYTRRDIVFARSVVVARMRSPDCCDELRWREVRMAERTQSPAFGPHAERDSKSLAAMLEARMTLETAPTEFVEAAECASR